MVETPKYTYWLSKPSLLQPTTEYYKLWKDTPTTHAIWFTHLSHPFTLCPDWENGANIQITEDEYIIAKLK